MSPEKELERHNRILEKISNANTKQNVPNITASHIARYLSSNLHFNGEHINQTEFKDVVELIIKNGGFDSPEIKNELLRILQDNFIEQTQDACIDKIDLVGSAPNIEYYLLEISKRNSKLEELQEQQDLEEHKEVLRRIKNANELRELPSVGRGLLNRKIQESTNNDFTERFAINKLQEISESIISRQPEEVVKQKVLEACRGEKLDEETTMELYEQICSQLFSDKRIGYIIEEMEEKDKRTLQIYSEKHQETMDRISDATRISQLPTNLTFSTLAGYFSGNTIIYHKGERISTTDLKDITQLFLDGQNFESKEVKEELKRIVQEYYPENPNEAYGLLKEKLESLPRTNYLVKEINYSQSKQEEFIGRSCSNVNVYFVPNPNSPVEGGKFYNCYINRVDNLDLGEILPLNLDEIVPEGMDVDSIEWYVQQKYDPTFKTAGGIILNKDETIGNVNVFRPSDGKVGITPEEKSKYEELESLGKQVKDIIKSKSEKAEKYRELQQMYIKYQEETDAQLAALEEKIDEILNKGKEEMSYED